jgi:hypothetical protein
MAQRMRVDGGRLPRRGVTASASVAAEHGGKMVDADTGRCTGLAPRAIIGGARMGRSFPGTRQGGSDGW